MPPSEVDFKTAHSIGKELANRLLEGKYSYVVATHIEKKHIHNHIIFCAADNIEHKKYHDCKKGYYQIRSLSDELCKENNLSVILPSIQKGKSYHEWYSSKHETSWKQKLQNDIDEAIALSTKYEDFINLIKAKGCEIKGESLTDNHLKYISFRPLDRQTLYPWFCTKSW